MKNFKTRNLNSNIKIDSIEQRSLQKNLLFLNVLEYPNQTPTSLAQGIYDVLATHMRIPVPAIFSQQYPAAEIRIDIVFRLDKFNSSNQNPRPVAVKFLTKLGRDLIFSKTYLKNLKSNSSPIKVVEQFTSITREKRSALYSDLTTLRDANPDSSKTRIILAKDKIMVNKNIQDTARFQANPLPDLKCILNKKSSQK